MTTNAEQPLLQDHGDARLLAADSDAAMAQRNDIIQLDPDHPGFRDEEYRARRNAIARIATAYRPGAPIPDAPYTPEEHRLWRVIRDAVDPQHQRHACDEYLQCARKLKLPRDRIPQLGEVSASVQSLSGFRLEPVAGLVAPRVFLESLANGVFLSTQYIRHHSRPLYTPEPDVVHELLGHAVTLASPRLAELNRLVGEAVKRTADADVIDRLARLYWFTLEFGVVRQDGAIKAYGSGLLSSAGELEEMHRAELRPLDLETAARQQYDPTDYQPLLFCADSFDAMYQTLKDYLLSWN